jgi:hypothetical protein
MSYASLKFSTPVARKRGEDTAPYQRKKSATVQVIHSREDFRRMRWAQSFNGVDDSRLPGQISHVHPFRNITMFLALLAALGSLHADPLDIWHQRDSGTSTNLNAVDYSAEGFVAVGDGGIVCHSEDGTSWQRYYLAPNPNLRSVSHNKGIYCVVGDGGHIYTSLDGVVWTARTSPTSNNLTCVRWLHSRFLAGGENGTLLSSLNGVNWEVLDVGLTYPITALAYGNGVFVAAANTFSHVTSLRFSTDAINWTNDTEDLHVLYDILHHDGRFIALSIRNQVHFSTNGLDWMKTYRTGNAPYYLTALTRDHGRYIAVGGPFNFGNARIGSSADGLSWQHHPVSINQTGALRGVAAGSFSVVAVGEGGLILQSSSTFRVLPHPQIINGERHWIVHGQPGRIYRLEATTNAATGPWEDVGKDTATNDIILLRDLTSPLPPFRFYRVTTP